MQGFQRGTQRWTSERQSLKGAPNAKGRGTGVEGKANIAVGAASQACLAKTCDVEI